MGTLAYDPERLGTLATWLGTASAALRTLHSADPEAQAALAVASRAAQSFETWQARVAMITGCSALCTYVPVRLDPMQLDDATAYVLATLYGWRTTSDPSGTRAFVPPAMRGASIGHLISAGRLGAATPEQAAALRTELTAVMLDPAARAAFLANLSVDGAADLADHLAAVRADAVWQGGGPPGTELARDEARRQQVADIDAIAGVLGRTMIDSTATLSAAREVLARVRPYTAALLVGQLDRDDQVVADLALDTLLRYRDSFADADLLPHDWEVRDRLFLGPADLLFPRIAAGSAQVANDFVQRLLHIDPTLLLVTAHQPAVTADLLLRASDPARIDVVDAGRVIRPYLELVRGQPVSPWLPAGFRAGQMESQTLLPTLGVLIAPWLMQFGGRAADWGWSGAAAADAFRFAIDDDDSFDALAAATERWGEAMVLTDVTDAGALLTNLGEVATTMGTLRELLNQRGGRRIADERIAWDFAVKYLTKGVTKGIGTAGLSGVPARVVVKVAALVVAQGAKFAEAEGLPGAPPPLEGALRQLDVTDDQANAVAAYVAMGLMVEVLIADGRLPADTEWPPAPLAGAACPSGDYALASAAWLDRAFADDDTARGLVGAARGAFISNAQSAAQCMELTYG